MPVPVRLTLADGTVVDTTVEVTGEGGTTTLCLMSEPTDVALDPDFWVLVRNADEAAGAPGVLVCGVEAPEDPDSGTDTADPGVRDADGVELSGGGCGCAAPRGPGETGLGLVAVVAAAGFVRRRHRA
jgi:MYXO-CTERM domain-containing protein